MKVDIQKSFGYTLPRMKHRKAFAPEAREDYKALPAHHRAEVRDAINEHLQFQPLQLSKNRLENDARFAKRIAKARLSLRTGRGVSWDLIQAEEDRRTDGTTQRRSLTG
ncbi:MAG: hypothetical protein HY360_13630 [Verrucomicrobia bacterium]|nr:hypothetical protein [Verrucomicrobiota bacterium]